jgi:peptide/nickel transport system permease protein
VPSFLLRRALGLLGALLAASAVIFVAVEVLPGDPARALLGVNAEPAAVEALQRQLGLDQPALVRYVHWLSGLVRGDLGTSWSYRVPVVALLAPRLAVTLPLALLAMVLTLVVSVVLGAWAALRRGSAVDIAIAVGTQIGLAIPNFWLGLLLILLFSVRLNWLPAGGFPGWDAGVWVAARSLLLPGLALAAVQIAILTRFTRAALLESAQQDFVRTAQAKGLSPAAAMVRHVLRNALVPITSIVGLQFAFLIAGAVVIENVFFLPGLGRFVFQAIANRDLIVVETVVLLLSALVIIIAFVADVTARAIDPRLRAAL